VVSRFMTSVRWSLEVGKFSWRWQCRQDPSTGPLPGFDFRPFTRQRAPSAGLHGDPWDLLSWLGEEY
jgi:hypothetical protein